MSEADDPVTPIPARYWWLKRISAGIVVILLGFVGIYFLITVRLKARVEAYQAGAHARGDIATIDDLNPPYVKVSDNAANLLNQAIGSSRLTPQEDVLIGDFFDAAPTPKDFAAVQPALKKLGPVFSLVRQSRAKPGVDWGVRYASPLYAVLLRHLNWQRELVNMIKVAAADAHRGGREAEALEYVRDIRHIGRCAASDPVIVCVLVGAGCDSSGCWLLREMTPTLDLSSAETRASARQMIGELLDDAPLKKQFVRALSGECVMSMDNATWLGKKSLALEPILVSTSLKNIAEVQRERGMIESNTPSDAREMVALRNERTKQPQTTAAALVTSLRLSIGRVPLTYLHIVGERRLTAAALAARLYQADHDGQLPPTLAALVPTYLPAVPVDPLDPNGAALRYKPNARFPAIYSVGDNGSDEGCNNDKGPMPWPQRNLWGEADAAVYLLSGSASRERDHQPAK